MRSYGLFKRWKLVAGIFIITALAIESRCSAIKQKKIGNPGRYFNHLKKHARRENHVKVCRSELCKKTADELIMSMNESADPCEDFYQFACGGWISKNPVPPTEPHWNQFDLINKKLDIQIRELFEEDDDQEDPFPVNSAKEAYRACMDKERVEEEGLDRLVDLLSEFGGWPMALPEEAWNENVFDWQEMVAETIRNFADFPIVSAYIYVDRKNSSRSVITIDQSSLVLPRSMLIDPSIYSKQIEAYRHWIASTAYEVSSSLKPPSAKMKATSKSRIALDAQDVVEFEMGLANISSPHEARRDAFRLYNPMSLKRLQKWTDSAPTKFSHSNLKWNRFFNILFKEVATIENEERIIVREVEYLFKLMALLERTPLRVIANYLHWRVVKTMCRETTQRLRELAFDFDRVLSGIKEDQPRWRDCILRVSSYMGFATGHQYVKRHFNIDAKHSAEEMVGHIRDAFKSEVEKLTWMDRNTKDAAREKADAMTQFIGYPDWFHNGTALEDYYKGLAVGPSHFENVISLTSFLMKKNLKKLHRPINRNEWTTSPAVVNAFYNPQKNAINIPSKLKHLYPSNLRALNYGSIGVVIGHEITHGFDDMGRQSDLHGNLVQWWSESTLETYLKKAQCFIDQYGSYRVPELEDLLGTEAVANGVITQGENIADNGGIRQAFLAYKRFVQQHGPEPRLVGLEKYTPEQLFYLGFATVWCESSTKESMLQELLSDPHSLHRLRVRGSLSNMEEFSNVFHCKAGSTMNPPDKCRLW
ncbi:hypothetical protein J437_LFUL001417 [Ladona fulva]|uniref:Uncharacterized protein n=1 Tax=Ladona fulva TaxID=123851 RepID=A0A8K0JTW9_LADFU|nr:hypothetical protein J437_LFUL001417 [Ladona fulva]